MNGPYTIAGIQRAFATEPTDVRDYLHTRLQHLREESSARRDPAWICLANAQQLESQLQALTRRSRRDCPLYGVPFAVKDNIDVAGWTTTAACPEFAYVARRTARVVERLIDAGAVLVGKTNLDQFATGLVGTRSPYGWVPNVFSPAHISGGSSSGSASVVARGLVPFALGTDTAGSGRVPAGFNNLVGLKPTPGIVSTSGVVPACRTLDCVSLLTLSAVDAELVFSVLTAPDVLCAQEPVFNRPSARRFGMPPVARVGVPRNPFFLDTAYRDRFEASCAHVRSLQWSVGDFDWGPFANVAKLLYQGPWTAERYTVAGSTIERGGAGVDPVVAEIIGSATRYSAVDAFSAIYKLRELEAQTVPVWEAFDVLMVPTAPGLPTYEDVCREPFACNSELGTYTNFVNLLGLAAVAVPFGFTAKGLPFGVTFIARGGSDWALLELAGQWQRSLGLPLGAGLGMADSADAAISTVPSGAIPLAVVGAHLRGMPLHHQLTERGARLCASTHTSPHYRLYALAGTSPSKPALLRADGGASIAVEVYHMPVETLGSLLAEIAPPLGLGSIELSDGCWVKGFICEPWALREALDITAFGGWRAYLAAQAGRGM